MVAPIIAAGARAAAGGAARRAAATRAVGGGANSGTGGKPRVHGVVAAMMITIAALMDMFQFFITFIPVVGIASLYVTILGLSAFSIWFLILGVPYLSGNRMGMKLGAFFMGIIVEALPFVNALPAITGTVVTVFLASRLEDRVRAQRPERKKQRMRLQTAKVDADDSPDAARRDNKWLQPSTYMEGPPPEPDEDPEDETPEPEQEGEERRPPKAPGGGLLSHIPIRFGPSKVPGPTAQRPNTQERPKVDA